MNNIPQTENNNFDRDYYEQVAGEKHSRSLENAIKHCKEKGNALDMGAGNLRDTRFLLREGFAVTAVDPSLWSLEHAKAISSDLFIFINDRIGGYDFPENHFSLVNAQSILFHLSSERFKNTMVNVKKTLKVGGVFVGDFLGVTDSWNIPESTKTFVTEEDIRKIFDGFDIKMLKETEEDSHFAKSVIDGSYRTKHWHWIKVIAIKK